jgi:hypothetical protein
MEETIGTQPEQKTEKTKTNKNTAIGCITMLIIAVFIIWLIYPKGERGEKIDAWTTAQGYVKQHLKAPASAKFQEYNSDAVQKISESSYQINSYVDSQNSFGALIRSRYVIKLHKKDKDWYYDYFVFDGEKLK